MTHQIYESTGATILSAKESWDLLAGMSLGRLVTVVDGRAEIFPVNYAVQRKTILFRTAVGTKLVSTAMNNQVIFEADDHDVAQGWSVIVRGIARSVRGDEQIAEADRAQVLPWTGSDKTHYVRVIPEVITGRRFQFGPAAG